MLGANTYLSMDVVTLLRSVEVLFPEKNWRPKVYFWPEKYGGQGPPGPIGDNIPVIREAASYVFHVQFFC